MVAGSTVIDPGLTCDEAIVLFGWTIWLAAMTGGASAVGSYPGARVHAYPSPTPSSISEPTGSLQRAPFQREKRPGSGVTAPGNEREHPLAAVGQHPSLPWASPPKRKSFATEGRHLPTGGATPA